MLARAAGLVACLVLLGGCAANVAASASPIVSIPAAESPAASASASPPGPTATPDTSATPVPTADPIVGYQKLQEGPHGGPQAVELPARIVAFYTVKGTCTFTIDIRRDDAKQTLVESLSRKEAGGESGAWHVALDPGSYYVIPGEAVGCTFTINVYPA